LPMRCDPTLGEQNRASARLGAKGEPHRSHGVLRMERIIAPRVPSSDRRGIEVSCRFSLDRHPLFITKLSVTWDLSRARRCGCRPSEREDFQNPLPFALNTGRRWSHRPEDKWDEWRRLTR